MVETVFQSIGDALTQALLSGDFAQYSALMALPLRVEPRGGQAYVMQDTQALQRDFNVYHAAIVASQVTDIYREVQSVQAQPGGAFRVMWMTHIFVHAHRIVDPFPSEMLLVPSSSGLRIAEVISAPEHIDWSLGRGALGPGTGLI